MEAFTCPSDIAPLSIPRALLHSLVKCKYSLMIHKEKLRECIARGLSTTKGGASIFADNNVPSPKKRKKKREQRTKADKKKNIVIIYETTIGNVP